MGEEAPPSPAAAATTLYVDGCPGCAMERRLESNKGIPYKELFFVAITSIATALPISSLFPFLYFMIEDLHVAKKEQDIGLYAGFLGASYFVGRFLASLFWGVVADRIGRKPIIIFSVFSVVIFNTLFGLSVKYWMAIATRLLLGALNGMLAPIKAYSIEVCRPEHQALGLSIVSTGWGIGLVIGPSIGGYFARPAQQYPNLFSDNSIFGRFPYLLPCLCISLFNLAVLVSCIWLPESLHKHKNVDREVEMSGDLRTPQTEDVHPKKSLYKNRPLMSSILAYCVFTLHDTAYSEIFSLWAISDRKYGGLSFSSKEVGQVLAIAGAGLLAYQLFIYRSVHKFLGSVNSCRVASVLSIPILAAYPFMTHLSGFKLGIALYLATIVKGVLAITILTGTSLLQNYAVPQSQRGAANGISATAMSFFKAIGPAGAGALFSWAQKRQDASFLPGDQIIFFILNVVEFIGLILTFKPFLALPENYDLK
ncbi:probable peptide/nitrate transporter At3g43790 [Phragmites australis]|uniref:probable peptide/nitrate transporter At3g43790 n=1 Tax=Phragmites australis TaxID=29695 RepID=UPI002D77CC39|nr:probable peptide/nitrate transporter At3g43790 [Phragmites australis]